MIDLGWLGYFDFSWTFASAVLSIVVIDLVLAGDNAVVIAMAVKNLPGRQRRWGIVLGSAGAVVVRIAATFLVSHLLAMTYVKLAGGAVIVWIAIKLLTDASETAHSCKEAGSLWQALWVIILADMSMGIDNMLAVGAASHGNLFLLLFGLALSIPFVVLMSGLLSRLMDRYPLILWIGAAILGRVGAEMMITDPWVLGWLNPPRWVQYGVQGAMVAFVCAAAWMWRWRRGQTACAAPAGASVEAAGQVQGR